MNKKVDIRKTPINGVLQNCYKDESLRIPRPVAHQQTIGSYTILEKKELPNGYTVNLEEKPYPINSETVTSYVESSDYRLDPMGFAANSVKRVNLGDISQVQDFVRSNPQDAIRIYRSVGEKLDKYLQELKQKEAGTPPAKGEENAN